MPLLPDSGDPGDIHEQLGIGEQKPDLLTDATWAEINGKYQLRGEKGRGAQAVVFEAEERAVPYCRVALKVYHENTDTARQQFENECRILASKPLPPEVVRYYGCAPGKDQCQPYLVIDFIDGTTLAKLALSLKSPLAFDVKVDLIEQLGRSFHRLHECNLIFGDGSANNILVEIDHRLRFVDLAGAKDIIKEHGRSRKSINLVTPGFFAQTDADVALTKDVRTNLATDLYAMSANAFLLLTGRTEDQCRSVGSRTAEREWDQALAQVHVPRGLRAIVLKGLRVPDPLKSNDLRLYPSAKAFANDVAAWRTRRQQRRSAVVFGLPALVCVAVLSVVALVGWSKYEAERTAFDLRQFEALQKRLPSLPNQPAITKLIKDVDDLTKQRQQQIKDQDTNSAARTLTLMTQKLDQAFATRAALEPCIKQRTRIARELVFDPQDAIIPWHVDNPFILNRLMELQTHNGKIRDLLERGDTDVAGKEMDTLQEQIYALETSNRRAIAVNGIQQRYDSLHGSVIEWLKMQPDAERQPMLREVNTTDQLAQSGQLEWTHGGWDSADRNLGQAIQGLNEWLDRHPMAKNSEIVQKKQQADVEAGLRSEVARLSGDIDISRKQRESLQTSLDALNEKLKLKDADTAKEKSRADELAKDKTKLAEQLTAVTSDKQALSDQLTAEKETGKKQLATIGEWKTKAEASKAMITNLKPSDSAAASGLLPFDASGLKAGDLRTIRIKGIETRWRWIPSGKFKMGSPSGEKGRDSDEDQKDVTISKGFWTLETEVTQELWTAVMGSSLDWDKYGKGPKHPVYNVSHTEASEFCVKFNALLKSIPEAAGLAVRLPTEAEWEYAARAGTTTRYYWGERDEDADQYAWHNGNSKEGTQPVGQKKDNAWGLKDMSGNVFEWCSDWYDAKLVGGIDPRGPSSGASRRVTRGGGWGSSVGVGNLRSAVRYGGSPGSRDGILGFRLACSSVGG